MQPTFYVGIVGVILLALLFRQTRVRSIWWFFAIAQVFGGTSVATLTALGGASLAVSQVGVAALVYAVFAMVAPRDFLALRRTISTHAAGIALIVYAVIISVMGPRLFAGQMNLVAMRPETLNGFIIATPLEPRSSNIAHLAYLVGSFLTALATSLVFCRKLTATDFRNAVLSAGLLHAALGAIDAVSSSLGAGWVLDFLRNANFSFVDQSIGNIKRISGSLAEASSYVTFSIPFGVFGIEEWWRTRRPAPGLVGLAIWIVALASTSTTGLIGAGIYAAVLFPRLVVAGVGFAVSGIILGVICAGGLIATGVSLARPDIMAAFGDFISLLTVDKVNSSSAVERVAWATQGWDAFQGSFGLGIGAGSFRSSSFPLAVIGSLGFVGSMLMLGFIAQVVRVTFFASRVSSTQRSAGWAALFALVPLVVSGPTPDPGFVFAMFAGFALHPLLASPEHELGGRLPFRSRQPV